MVKLFLWFYCLPIENALLLILLATASFFLLRKKLRNVLCWKIGVGLLFLAWIVVIIFGTLGYRTEGGNLPEPVLTPFASYCAVLNGGTKELLRTNFMNVVLFYPAGLLGCEILPKHWKRLWKVTLITALFAIVSIGIEYIQYRFAMGLTEADDVIHNTLGVILGGIACVLFEKK